MKKSLLTAACVAVLVGVAAGVRPGQESRRRRDQGQETFSKSNCAVCHNADSDEKKMGPGLKGLFKRDKLNNGKKPTEANVRRMINKGGNGMPAYADMLTRRRKRRRGRVFEDSVVYAVIS